MHKTLNLLKITESGHIYSYVKLNFQAGLFSHIATAPYLPTHSLRDGRKRQRQRQRPYSGLLAGLVLDTEFEFGPFKDYIYASKFHIHEKF